MSCLLVAKSEGHGIGPFVRTAYLVVHLDLVSNFFQNSFDFVTKLANLHRSHHVRRAST